MRFLYGLIAFALWAILCTAINTSAVSADVQLLTLAIAMAGAMAGGD
jgi:hypothetical protein